MSFKNIGLMDELEKSIKYVPTYQLIKKIRSEEQEIRIAVEKQLKDKLKKHESTVKNVVDNLYEKQMSVEQIAGILNITPKEVRQYLKKEKTEKLIIYGK